MPYSTLVVICAINADILSLRLWVKQKRGLILSAFFAVIDEGPQSGGRGALADSRGKDPEMAECRPT